MTKREFKKFVNELVDIYGVRSYLDNIEDDMTQEEIDDDLWFETPCCQDVVYYDDIDEEWEDMLMNGICPICEEPFDEEE